MEYLIDVFEKYDYTLLVVGAFLLFWLYWLPRIIAPILAPHYAKLSPKIRALLALFLPTIERVMLDSWSNFYIEVLDPLAKETPTDLDDKILEEIDKIVRKYFDPDE